jgi:hypothetical protein
MKKMKKMEEKVMGMEEMKMKGHKSMKKEVKPMHKAKKK